MSGPRFTPVGVGSACFFVGLISISFSALRFVLVGSSNVGCSCWSPPNGTEASLASSPPLNSGSCRGVWAGVVGSYSFSSCAIVWASASADVLNDPSGCFTTSGSGAAKCTSTFFGLPRATASKVKFQGTPLISAKSRSSHWLDSSRLLTVLHRWTPLDVPTRCSSDSSARPSQMPGSILASIFWRLLPCFLRLLAG